METILACFLVVYNLAEEIGPQELWRRESSVEADLEVPTDSVSSSSAELSEESSNSGGRRESV